MQFRNPYSVLSVSFEIGPRFLPFDFLVNQVVVTSDACLFRILMSFYIVKPLAVSLVANLALGTVLFQHLFAYLVCQCGAQIFPFGSITQAA